ncbi:hypothetical protein GCM10022252_75480 [Streptosporangium oxazolinicum]|uniref:Uncharacterized protein n=1 Tax=Streptosporangium oxazolinicum TaxID=909287 RepID=A0ABP8BKV5_9ACTN
MMAARGRTPTDEELADARRSARLAATQGFPPGVCPYDPRDPGQSVLARVWAQAYTTAKDSDADDGENSR